MLTGIRLAGEMSEYTKPVGQFARHLGVAFQILNDLKDWNGDDDNKLGAGLDVLGGRPTVLLALALEGLDGDDCADLLRLVDRECPTEGDIERVRMLYASAGVFEKADRLVDKYQDRAEEIADEIESEELRRLFYYLIDTVLDRVGTEQPDAGVAVVDIVMPGS